MDICDIRYFQQKVKVAKEQKQCEALEIMKNRSSRNPRTRSERTYIGDKLCKMICLDSASG